MNEINNIKPYTELKRCPFCNSKRARLEENRYEGFAYLVKCQDCYSVAEGSDSEFEAVDNWNNEKFTETTVKLNTPHNLHIDGIIALTERLLSDHAEMYQAMYAVIKSGHFRNEKDQERLKERLTLMENFFTRHPVMEGIPADGNEALQSVKRKAEMLVESREKEHKPIATKEEIKRVKNELDWRGTRRKEQRRPDFWKKTREA